MNIKIKESKSSMTKQRQIFIETLLSSRCTGIIDHRKPCGKPTPAQLITKLMSPGVISNDMATSRTHNGTPFFIAPSDTHFISPTGGRFAAIPTLSKVATTPERL